MKLTHIAVLAAASAAAVFAQLPTTKMLTVDVAQSLAQEAMMKCRADGYKVTVQVVDSGNFLKAFLRDDGAGLATIDVARMKATSVIPGTINAMGGVPIKVGEQTIGAVSVSGAPGGDKDAACANAALTKLADRLK